MRRFRSRTVHTRRSSLALVLVLLASCYATGDPMNVDTGAETGGYETGGPGDPIRLFWISETTNFAQSSQPSCPNTNLNNVGTLAESTLEDDGWTGTYVLNGETTRRDFADSTVLAGGRDHLAADTVDLAIYAGHGNVNSMQWGNPDAANQCSLPLSNFMRLGLANGNLARLVVSVTSCTLNVPTLQNNIGASAAGQYLGWHNSPSVGDFVIRDFYDTTQVMIENGKPLTNRLSWMAVGQVKPGLGGNSPVIFTEQGDDEDVGARHFGARVSEGTGTEIIPDMPNLPFRVTWIDNGNCP